MEVFKVKIITCGDQVIAGSGILYGAPPLIAAAEVVASSRR